ncbi:MAG: electron transfer flavoprotein subunit alpha [Dehalococcoidia bacterium]|nr:electron transfer flavoprotein subunit alpha [Dehalococcoidia bacterium]
MSIRIDIEKCTGCGSCEPACPFGVIKVVKDVAQIGDGCNLCGACKDVCSFEAIVIEVPVAVAQEKDDSKGVWVFAEQRDGQIKGVVYELLNKGRELAKVLNTGVSAICLGHNIDGVNRLFEYGADKVYLFDDPALAGFQDDLYARCIVDLIREQKPQILLAGATSLGRAFIPRVAAMLETGLTADCTGLDIDPETGLLLQTRPTFGGNIMATIVCRTQRPQMATVRPHVFKKGNPAPGRAGEVIRMTLDGKATDSRVKVLQFIEDVTEKIKVEDAEIIVAGGRGLGKGENFKLIEELADALGAAVGASRAVVDDGWVGYSHQIGQTGKTVCPKLYIACGISGAVQHLAGMQTSDIIVAINEDPRAPIFDVATYGIVGDLFEIVPMLTARIRDR